MYEGPRNLANIKTSVNTGMKARQAPRPAVGYRNASQNKPAAIDASTIGVSETPDMPSSPTNIAALARAISTNDLRNADASKLCAELVTVGL
jgi:hypothetical protein